MDIGNLIVKVSSLSVLIPISLGILYYKHFNTQFKVLVWYFIFCGIIESFAAILKNYTGNNLILFQIYVPCEFFFLSFIFHKEKSTRVPNWIFITLSIIFICLYFYDLFGKGTHFMNNLARSSSSLILIFYSLNFYFSYFRNNSETPVFEKPMFWVSTAVFCYFGVSFFYFLLGNVILSGSKEIGIISKDFHSVINIVAYLIFSFSLLIYKKWIKK